MAILELNKYVLFKEEDLNFIFEEFNEIIRNLVAVQERKSTIQTSEIFSDWLRWCKEQTGRVKVIDHEVPPKILPNHFKGILYDIKVQGKKWAPDDQLYDNHHDLRYYYGLYECTV